MTRLWPVVLALVACRPPAPHRASTIRDCSYDVELLPQGRAHVQATCRADGPISFRVAHRYLKNSVSGAGRAPHGKLTYDVDLAQLAGQGHDFDRALRVGDSFVAPMSSVLLVPEPLSTEIPVQVRVRAAPPAAVSVGLTRDSAADTYRLFAHEIPVATYFAFGKLEQRTLDVAGARLELTRLDGALDQPFDEVSRWVETSARAVRDFYGAFPVPRAQVSIIPVPRRDAVVFGKVLPESSPGVALLIGEHAPARALYTDWILVHELFHLGFPSFFEEGKWLDEGLATYYEPVIRVRAGLYSERELWDELLSSMPQGAEAFTQSGLEHATDFRGIYWGGAIACLVADVSARKRQLNRGLEVGLRALREAGGNACEVWSLSEAIGAIDHALGAPTLAPIAAAHAQRGSAFDLAGLFADLGVSRDAQGNLQLSDRAPLAEVRRAITAKP
ncbi:MAG: hypothetical protein EOO73_34925 [Myxococcales bacterium]|nr:MAG: hypothetical protein EOO73_34925 [Myxococcales bacterium]